MSELFASTAYFGMFLTLGLYQLARVINRRVLAWKVDLGLLE